MKVTIKTTEPQSREMYNLSELIKTDCCIDCGSNEKLREVVGKIGVEKSIGQDIIPLAESDTMLRIRHGKYATYTYFRASNPIPITSINIDL